MSLNYFQLLQVRLIQGRHFAPTDRAEAPRVALVNQTLARRLESSGDVVGRSIRVGNAANSPIVQIVGVIADSRWWGMTLDPLSEVYVPLDQHSASYGFLIVHSTLGVAELTAAIKRTFYAALPGAAVLAYSVMQRRRELDVRVALGAQPGDLIKTTMRSAIMLTAIGVASGLAAAVMLMTAAVAAYLPARRAARADPMQSLRYE